MCWFIVKLRWHTPTVAEINPSGLVMRLQVVYLSPCVASTCLRCMVADKTLLCQDTLIILPLRKMGSRTPFWQYIPGPGAWLCTTLMVLLREERRRMEEMRDKWSGGQMNNVACARVLWTCVHALPCSGARTLNNTLDRPCIVPAICVSMVTERVGTGGKVWRNLPDNPEGQHAVPAHSITQCSQT